MPERGEGCIFISNRDRPADYPGAPPPESKIDIVDCCHKAIDK